MESPERVEQPGTIALLLFAAPALQQTPLGWSARAFLERYMSYAVGRNFRPTSPALIDFNA